MVKLDTVVEQNLLDDSWQIHESVKGFGILWFDPV